MSPRLGEFVRSFSQSGLFTCGCPGKRNGGRGIVWAFRHGNVDLPTRDDGLKVLPLQSRYGMSLYEEPPLGWIRSPVWLTTTSRITFMPSECAQLAKAAKSSFVPRCGSTRVKSTPQYP